MSLGIRYKRYTNKEKKFGIHILTNEITACILFLKFQDYVLLKQIYAMSFSSSIRETSNLEACSFLSTGKDWMQRRGRKNWEE